MKLFSFLRRVRHPLFPDLTATPASRARGLRIAIAGTFGELAGAAARGVRARRAVFVLTHEGNLLSDGERDELWRLFEVPVLALLLDGAGRVIAWECEAQNGMHVAGPSTDSDCACGRPGARVMVAEQLARAGD